MKDVIQRHRAHRKGDISCSTFDIKMASKHLNALLVSKLNCVHVMPVELRPGSSTLLHIEHIIIFIFIYLFYFISVSCHFWPIPPGIARHQYNIGLQYIHLPVILHGANLIGRTNFKRAKLSVHPPPPPSFSRSTHGLSPSLRLLLYFLRLSAQTSQLLRLLQLLCCFHHTETNRLSLFQD